MATKQTTNSSPTDLPEAPTTTPKRKTYTRWDAFDAINLVPTEIRCEGYHQAHPQDMSCHSRLPIQAQSMIDHYLSEHGGGFLMKVKIGESPWAGWKELQDKGVELEDFRCGECLQAVRVNPADIQAHMKPHLAGKRMKISETFLLTISQKNKTTFKNFEDED
jgi:hypothetical protein